MGSNSYGTLAAGESWRINLEAPVKVRHADGTHHSSSANMQGGTKGHKTA